MDNKDDLKTVSNSVPKQVKIVWPYIAKTNGETIRPRNRDTFQDTIVFLPDPLPALSFHRFCKLLPPRGETERRLHWGNGSAQLLQ